MRVWHSACSWLKLIVAAESVAGNTRTGMFTRLILRKPFQVGRAAMACSPVSCFGAARCDYRARHEVIARRSLRLAEPWPSPRAGSQRLGVWPARRAILSVRQRYVPADVADGDDPACVARGPGERPADAGHAGRAAARPAPGSSTSRSTTASGRSCDVAAGARRAASASGRASATRRRRSFPRSCARSSAFARDAARRRSSSTARSSRSTSSGRPAGFQRLQGRIHLTDARDVERIERAQPVALIAFDLLRDGDEDLRGLPLTERRARLEKLASATASAQGTRARSAAACSEQVGARRRRRRACDARAHRGRMGRAHRQGGARAVSVRPPQPGVAQAQAPAAAGIRRRRLDRAAADAPALRRAAARRPRRERPRALIYVGHTGTGFDQTELARVSKLLKAAREPNDRRSRTDQDERAGPLGAPRPRRAGAVHRVDRRRQAAASGVSRAARRQAAGGRGARDRQRGEQASVRRRSRPALRVRDAARPSSPSCARSRTRAGTARSSCPTANGSTSRTWRRSSGPRREAHARAICSATTRGLAASSCRPSRIGRS